MPTSLKELTDAEAQNLDANTKRLGNSVKLVNDFESVYDALLPLISLPHKAYRDAFRPKDIFPGGKHPDHEPTLTQLKSHYDLCSKIMHGSIFGIAGHFVYPESSSVFLKFNYFDLKPGRSSKVALIPMKP
jgi:hypothetical protein